MIDFAAEQNGDSIRVHVWDWYRAVEVCKPNFPYFSFLSAIDWLPNPNLDGEQQFAVEQKEIEPPQIITDTVIRKAGGDKRFQLFSRLSNPETHESITLFTDLDDDQPAAQSITPLYKGADWHERETWEMFGIDFTGHPGLRHIYLPEEFEGNPLRKDFPLVARLVRPWPGLVDMEEMPAQEVASE